ESLVFHSQRNHVSHWLMARTEFAVAQRLRPRKVSDFPSPEDLRHDVIRSIEDYRQQQNQVLVGDFQPSAFKPSPDFFLRLGSRSLGGKARGLAFVRYLLHKSGISKRFPGVRIAVPPTLVVATDLFDLFLKENDLLSFALHCNDDEQILKRFLEAKLPPLLEDCLLAFLK